MSLDKLPTHSSRHTYGTLGLHKSLSVGDVEDTLGHKSLEMVAHYLHEDVDPDGIGTMKSGTSLRQSKSPSARANRRRTSEKRRHVTEEKQDRTQVLDYHGTPVRTRTPDPRIRNPVTRLGAVDAESHEGA